MSRATIEFDFFRMEKENSTKSRFQKLFEQRRTARGFQSAISKINPQLLKTVIASGAASGNTDVQSPGNDVCLKDGDSRKSLSVPSTPNRNRSFVHTLPVFNPNFRSSSASPPETAPLTIFYNGTLSVFDLPLIEAEKIMNLAIEGRNLKTVEPADEKLKRSSTDEHQLIETLNGDLPIARKKSLQRFLEKRKERFFA